MPHPRRNVTFAAAPGEMLAPRDLYHQLKPSDSRLVDKRCERCRCVMATDRHPRAKYCSPCERKVLQW